MALFKKRTNNFKLVRCKSHEIKAAHWSTCQLQRFRSKSGVKDHLKQTSKVQTAWYPNVLRDSCYPLPESTVALHQIADKTCFMLWTLNVFNTMFNTMVFTRWTRTAFIDMLTLPLWEKSMSVLIDRVGQFDVTSEWLPRHSFDQCANQEESILQNTTASEIQVLDMVWPYQCQQDIKGFPNKAHLKTCEGGERKPARVFSVNTFYTRHLLNQTPFTPDTFYTRHLLHQTPFTPGTLYTKQHRLHQAPFHETHFTPDTFYTRQLSQQTTFTPTNF